MYLKKKMIIFLNIYKMEINNNIEILEKLKTNINNLEYSQKLEIFKLILEHNIQYTQNTNGIYINLSLLNDYMVNIFSNYIVFLKENQKVLNIDEKKK